MNINLQRRYPNSRTEDITDAFARGFEVGHKAGYHDACKQLQGECKKLQDMLRAMLDATVKGEIA